MYDYANPKYVAGVSNLIGRRDKCWSGLPYSGTDIARHKWYLPHVGANSAGRDVYWERTGVCACMLQCIMSWL